MKSHSKRTPVPAPSWNTGARGLPALRDCKAVAVCGHLRAEDDSLIVADSVLSVLGESGIATNQRGERMEVRYALSCKQCAAEMRVALNSLLEGFFLCSGAAVDHALTEHISRGAKLTQLFPARPDGRAAQPEKNA